MSEKVAHTERIRTEGKASPILSGPSSTLTPEQTEEQIMEEVIAELAKIDPHERFEAIKAKFFMHDTYLGDAPPGEEYYEDKEEIPTRLMPTRAQLEKSIQELIRRESIRDA